jgi:hypothetical protein
MGANLFLRSLVLDFVAERPAVWSPAFPENRGRGRFDAHGVLVHPPERL